MRAHDILRGCRSSVRALRFRCRSIRRAQGVRELAVLRLRPIHESRKVWLDKTPHSLLEALKTLWNTNCSMPSIHGFALHWDLEDLTKAMGTACHGTDPTNWMGAWWRWASFSLRWVSAI